MRIKTKTRHSCTNIQSKHNDNHAVSLYETGIVYAESAITYVGTEGGRQMTSSHLVSWSAVERTHITTSFIKISMFTCEPPCPC